MSGAVTTGSPTSWRWWCVIWMFGAVTGALAFGRWSAHGRASSMSVSETASGLCSGARPAVPTTAPTQTGAPKTAPLDTDLRTDGTVEEPTEPPIVHTYDPVESLPSRQDRESAQIALKEPLDLDDGQAWSEINHRVARVLHIDDTRDVAIITSLAPEQLCKESRISAVVVRDRRVVSSLLLGTGCLVEPDDVRVLRVRGRSMLIFRQLEGANGYWSKFERFFWQTPHEKDDETKAPGDSFAPVGCVQTGYDNTAAGWSGPGDEFVWHGEPRFSKTGDLRMLYKVEQSGPRNLQRHPPRTESFRFDGVERWHHLTAEVSRDESGPCHSWNEDD